MPAQTIGIQPAVPQRVSLAIGNAAKRTGVPFNYLMAQARVESSLDPDAQASSSSAAGLFQPASARSTNGLAAGLSRSRSQRT